MAQEAVLEELFETLSGEEHQTGSALWKQAVAIERKLSVMSGENSINRYLEDDRLPAKGEGSAFRSQTPKMLEPGQLFQRECGGKPPWAIVLDQSRQLVSAPDRPRSQTRTRRPSRGRRRSWTA